MADPATFLVLIVGTILAVGLTLCILVLTGKAKIGGAGRLPEFRKRVPELAALPEEEQIRIVNRSVLWTAAPGIVAVFTFAWAALAYPPLLDAINASSRSAGAIGVVVLIVILFPLLRLQTVLVRRAVRAWHRREV